MRRQALIRIATENDLDAVEEIYNEIHREEENGKITTGWLRNIYPIRETAEAAVKRGDLFVLEERGVVLGSGIINQIQVDVYATAAWENEVPDHQVCVLHTLTIAPSYAGRGLGTQFVNFYERFAAERGFTELRIDTNARNTAARAMYRRLGYKEIGIVPTVFNGIPDVQLVLLEKKITATTEEA